MLIRRALSCWSRKYMVLYTDFFVLKWFWPSTPSTSIETVGSGEILKVDPSASGNTSKCVKRCADFESETFFKIKSSFRFFKLEKHPRKYRSEDNLLSKRAHYTRLELLIQNIYGILPGFLFFGVIMAVYTVYIFWYGRFWRIPQSYPFCLG